MSKGARQRNPAAVQALLRRQVGSSMKPTLREHDLLEVLPYDGCPIRVGDVVLFTPPGGGRAVAHRVVAIAVDSLRTRGDHNREPDPWLVQSSEVDGRVVAVRRGESRRGVAGGVAGRVALAAASARRVAVTFLLPLLGPPYRLLASTGLPARLVPRRFRPRVVTFRKPHGLEAQLLLGRRRIGRYDPASGRWLVERPFRLLADERRLPHPE